MKLERVFNRLGTSHYSWLLVTLSIETSLQFHIFLVTDYAKCDTLVIVHILHVTWTNQIEFEKLKAVLCLEYISRLCIRIQVSSAPVTMTAP